MFYSTLNFSSEPDFRKENLVFSLLYSTSSFSAFLLLWTDSFSRIICLESGETGSDSKGIRSNSTSCPERQTGKGHLLQIRHQKKNNSTKTTMASLLPIDDHKVNRNKSNKKYRQTGWTITIRVNHSRSDALKRSIMNYWDGVLYRFYAQQLHPSFYSASYRHRRCLVRIKGLFSCQDSSLKRSTIKHWWAEPKTDQQAFANLTHGSWYYRSIDANYKT